MTDAVQRFQPSGLLAIDQRAFGMVVSELKAPTREVERIGQAAVVRITGPLNHHKDEGFLDSYEDLSRRFTEAFDSDAKAVVMVVDSPGGFVAGCFPCALALRARRDASEKPLIAYVSGNACSAAYALASQADRIVIAPGAFVGHVGVIEARLDMTKADAAMGMQYAFVVSGHRKAFGNPHLPLTEDELAVRQVNVDANASVFFELVAERRTRTTAKKLKALQAGTFSGSVAIDHGLADEVGTFEGLLASIASQQLSASAGGAKGLAMSMRDDLEKASKGEGDDAERAKRALKAWDEDEKKKDEEAKAKAAKEEEDAKAAAASKAKAEEEEEKKKDEEAKAAAAAASQSASSQSTEMKAVIESQQRIEKANRRMILDSRPDLTAEQRAFADTLPVDKAQEYLGTIPKGARPNHAATITPASTRAEGQDGSGAASQLSPAEKAALDAQMGLSAITYTGVESTPFKVVLGAPVPVKREAKAG